MNGKYIVVDTNILLYFLTGDVNVRKFFSEYSPVISFVTELELLSAPEISSDQKEFINELLSNVTIVKYADEHKNDILKVRSTTKLKLPDSIIVALSITLGIPLVTADKSLKNVAGLDVVFYSVLGND